MNTKKRSNYYLAAFFAMLFVAISIIISLNGKEFQAKNDPTIEALEAINIKKFKHIRIEGNLRANIQNNKTQKVYSQGTVINHDISFTNNLDTLIIENNNANKNKEQLPAIFINTNNIGRIQVNNKAKIKLKNYTIDTLQVFATNNAIIEFDKLYINNFHIILNNNAEINGDTLSGTLFAMDFENNSKLWIRNLNYDKISGNLKKKSRINFKGNVKEINLYTDESSNINKYTR